ncbi:hormogonium polysaccharide biosynthesis glycosyltransferase HpsE [Aetokthonos hydrillicola Thurmond2011]|jgi:glycosyltransferase involved in cell wall biosynthesis|uniref:Hormogonium polysaccharide biosynthesis glycosyltransferase HpsE n=1 Tax=Aetokthonos hydrillicola Thurmond2011 TaxID=2712845 RepID=A0AAP5I7P5_9CYAN|nr:hormogonium polysaccharide biosynthesis glycosyltransferase HpsE [Aetokthonos hydrillicola]MBO3459791.1 glycosyltransferase family 2 protein [Aetokthonos hydrillicola CCALA 1050]MBW4584564.1 hormogonium polysaccharide biosynthesis glycosyltransferase HpsE [Aetokthonos hydrillicola CCALA 1050]MDR9895107.1 hormogonium polysaccharide biosynthesis glycosyltransferase HpsE [Aetokthonos hydrillicola Thurmond2011]
MNKIAIQRLDITVAIPTYNGEARLPKILDGLRECFAIARSHIESQHITCEVLVIDNNSTDNTAKLIQNYQATWDENFPLRYLRETQQGAAFARLLAVREAKGEYIAFLDDDNLPAPDLLKEAYTFGKQHPQAGAWSGQIHGDYQVKPPNNFERIQAFLAIREHGDNPFLFDADNLRLPPAACLVVRKQAWIENVPVKPKLTGKLPGVLVQGDDYEPLLYIHKAGWQIWYNPKMHTYHQIPHWRLEKDYLLSLSRGCGLCTCQLRFINAEEWQKPIVFIRTIFGNLRRVVKHSMKYRGELQTDLIALCEMEFYISSMISPFYWLKNYLRPFW